VPRQSARRRRARRASVRRQRAILALAVGLSLVAGAGSAYTLGLLDRLATTDPRPVAAGVPTAAAESATLRAALATAITEARAVLAGPNGTAAQVSERRALATAIASAEGVLRSREAAGSPGDEAPAATTTLRDATAAVVASGREVRVGRAVPGLETARTRLRTVVADGEEAYAGSEPLAAPDDSGRDGLRAELDRADDLVRRADGLLAKAARAGTDPAAAVDVLHRSGELTTALAEATERIQDAASAVIAGTAVPGPMGGSGADAGATAPAGTCPEADQVWSAENGHLSPSELAQIPFAPGHSVRSDVVGGLAELNAAYAAVFGVNLTISSSYRTYASQEALYDPSSKTAAPPGCSNHGTGLAVDIGGGVQAFGSPQYEWLQANAEAYGWVHPPFAEPFGRNPEPWHWQSVEAPNSS